MNSGTDFLHFRGFRKKRLIGSNIQIYRKAYSASLSSRPILSPFNDIIIYSSLFFLMYPCYLQLGITKLKHEIGQKSIFFLGININAKNRKQSLLCQIRMALKNVRGFFSFCSSGRRAPNGHVAKINLHT